MKHKIVWIVFFVAVLSMSLMVMAKENNKGDEHGYTCTTAKVAGEWGYTETGWVILPSGSIPYGSVGRLNVDRDGNVSGRRTASAAGQIKTGSIEGKIEVNPDCTGTLTQTLCEDSGGCSTATKAIVFLNNATEAHMIITSSGLPVVLTVVAKKVSADHANEVEEGN